VGSVTISLKLRGSKGEVVVKALVDTGFYGDVITRPEVAKVIGVGLKYRRSRRLPDGRVINVSYGGGEIELEGEVTHGDIEVWEDLKLPKDIDALLGVTALEKLGFKVDPRTGRLEKVELYLL
jgi:clan AA aspartic protease